MEQTVSCYLTFNTMIILLFTYVGKTVITSIVTVEGKQTIRHQQCHIAVQQGVVRCKQCTAHRKTLHSAVSRLHSQSNAELSPSAHSSTSPSSHANLEYLTAPGRALRVRTLQGRLKTSRQFVSRLKTKIKKLTEMQGVGVEPSLEEDLVTVMNQHDSEITEQYDENSFQALFWRQQQEALRSGKGVRWHPLMIKWCLYLHHCSSGAYKMLRNLKCLSLPSERTLQDYTHFNSTKAGFSDATDDQLREYARLSDTPNHKNLVGLLFDEMHIKEGLVFNKSTGSLVGSVDLGDINNAFLRYSNSESDSINELPLAKSVMFIED